MNDEDLRDLYQETLFELAKSRVRRGKIDGAASVLAVNPLCGDEVEFSSRIISGVVINARYECKGCAISQAAAALAAEAVEGLGADLARELLHQAIAFVSVGHPNLPDTDWQALAGVRKFPLRVKCATMPLRAALASMSATGVGTIELEGEA